MKDSVGSWIFQPEMEKMSRNKLLKLQEERLIKMVKYCYEKVPVYRRKFKDAGIKPDDIKSLDDLEKIPFTEKEDLRKAYPYEMLAANLCDVLELHASSGTTGHPTTCAYTKNDLEVWSKVMARIYASAGTKKGDIVQNAYGYGLFTGGLGFHYGALEIGATILPIAAGETERQITLAKEYGTTILACTPSYAAHIGRYAREKIGINPAKELRWKSGLFGAEAWSEELRERIEELLGLEAFDIYGLSEVIGPGVSVECPQHNGLHIQEDHFLPEIIDPKTGERVEEGETGELVLTTLTREATPVLRFRTGDITFLKTEECSCGRTLTRMGRVYGRADDMIKVRGVKFWPKTVEHALLNVKGASENYEIVIERPEELDIMTLRLEPDRELFESVNGDLLQLQGLAKEIEEQVKSVVGVKANVELVPYGTLPRFVGKARRVKDLRKAI
ncbi:MAG: phenylacetate--CoA ligase [Candidatus Bathyarchaeota archaeon]|jgi:phenylacetate-CoA ligase|nr:phenylacetate--CoA ligase [Candidatus Bathyarchaeota archaeon]